MGPGSVQRSSPSAEAIAAQQAAEAARRAEEARRRAEEAARRAAEEARKAAEEARKAAEAARKKAEDAKRAAEAAEKKAAETKAKQDAEEAAKLRKQAEADEAAALKKEAEANLKDKQAKLAESKLDDVRQRRPDTEPSAATRKAEAEVKAAKETMEIFEPPAGQPTAGGEASAETKALLDKAQKIAKPVFEAQARGEKPTDEQVKAVNQAVNDWLKAAEQDMRTAGLEAQAKGEDPNKAIHARGEQIKKDLDKGGVFDPEWMGGHVDAGRDAVKAETPAIRQVRSEQYELQTDGKKQLAEATDAAAKANEASEAASKRAKSFTSVSTDSQVTAKQEAEAEAARLAEVAEQANRKLEGLKKTFGVSDAADPKNNTVGTLDAEYDAKVADLEVQDLAGRRNAAIAAGDTKTADSLGLQLDDALARQRLARTRSDALKADLDLADAKAEKADADNALELAQQNAPQLREVCYSGRNGKSTQTITPEGYDKTLWVKPGDKNVREIDGKWYLVEKTRSGEKKTELHPANARVFEADQKLKESQAAYDGADASFKSANEDILGPMSGRAPGKLDIEALGDPKKINDDVTATSHNAWVAQNDLNKAIAAGKSDAEIAKLRQDLGAKLQAWESAKAQQAALKALTELRDAERSKASGNKDVTDKKIEELRTTARDAVDKAREKPLLSADDEKKLRADAKAKSDALKTQDAEVEKARKADQAAKPEDKAATAKALQDAMDKRDQLALESRDLDSRIELLDAERQSLAAKDEYGRTQFAKPHEGMYADSQGNGKTATFYPDNYDPTWDITPDKLPEGAKVTHCGDDWYVTFDKDSKVLGLKDDKTPYLIREGSYKMHPATARVWAADERLKAAQENRNTVIEDRAKAAVDQPAAKAAAPVGLDGKPLPTLNINDDLGARKKTVDGQVTDANKLVKDLEDKLKTATGDTTELKAQLEDAKTAQQIALSEQSAVDAMLAWQTAHRQRQMDDANARAGRPLQYSSGDTPLAEKVNDLRDTALKKKSEWLTLRDKHGVDLAQRTLDKATKAHDTWKREHPYLMGSERNSDSWKALEKARGGLDIAKRQQVYSANEKALIEQQQFISSRLRENEHEDPNKLYKLFMENKQVMAQSVINQHYVEYGGEPMQMAGRNHIGNEVAFALGFSPSVKLDPGTPSVNAQRRREENLFTTLSSDQKKVYDSTVDKIIELGGQNARVTVLPVVYALDGENGGIVKTALFKVERADGSHKFVDDQGREYKDTDDFRANNMLPVENVDLAMPADGKYDIDDKGNVKLFTGDARTETGWENFRRTKHVDAIVGGVGFVAGVVLTVGSLGALSVPGVVMMGAGAAMMGAGAYGVVTSAQSLHNQAEHGVSINPFTNEQARMDWMNLGLSAASIPVAGASGRAAQLMIKARGAVKAADEAKAAGNAVEFARHMDDAANYMQRAQAWGRPAQAASKPLAVASVPVLAEGGRQLAVNWDHLDTGQRIEQIGMMGMNLAGFASPVFAKGYVRIHNGFKNQYAKLKGSSPGDGAPAAGPDPAAIPGRSPALAPFQEGASPLAVAGRDGGSTTPQRLLGPDGLPVGGKPRTAQTLLGPDGQPVNAQPTSQPIYGPDGQPLRTTGAPAAPRQPPRLVMPHDDTTNAVQSLITAQPHQIRMLVQDATATATDTPIAGHFSDAARPVLRSNGRTETKLRHPTHPQRASGPQQPRGPGQVPQPGGHAPATDSAWTVPRSRLDDFDQASVLYAVHAAGGRLEGARYVVARWEADPLTGRPMQPSQHGIPEGMVRQTPTERAAAYELAAREGIPDLVEPAYFDTLDAALAAAQARPGVGADGVFIVSDHAVSPTGEVPGSGVIGTVAFRRQGDGTRFQNFRFNPGYEGPLRVALPEGFESGAPLIARVNGKPVDFANAAPGRELLQLNLFERRVADLVITADPGGRTVNAGPKQTLDGATVLTRDGQAARTNPLPDEVPAPPGYFILDGHGFEGRFQDADGSLAFGDEVAAAIRNHPDYVEGQPVLAYVCFGAQGASPLLQHVSTALGADVYGMHLSPAIKTQTDGQYTHMVDAYDGLAPYNAGDIENGMDALPIVQIRENGRTVYEHARVVGDQAVHRFRPGLPIVQVREGGQVVHDAANGPVHTHRRPAGTDFEPVARTQPSSDGQTRTNLRSGLPARPGGEPQRYADLEPVGWPNPDHGGNPPDMQAPLMQRMLLRSIDEGAPGNAYDRVMFDRGRIRAELASRLDQMNRGTEALAKLDKQEQRLRSRAPADLDARLAKIAERREKLTGMQRHVEDRALALDERLKWMDARDEQVAQARVRVEELGDRQVDLHVRISELEATAPNSMELVAARADLARVNKLRDGAQAAMENLQRPPAPAKVDVDPMLLQWMAMPELPAAVAADVHAHLYGYDYRAGNKQERALAAQLNREIHGRGNNPIVRISEWLSARAWTTRGIEQMLKHSPDSTRILFGNIPQFCGEGHYSNANAPKLTMKRAARMDRELGEQFLRHWLQYEKAAAAGDAPKMAEHARVLARADMSATGVVKGSDPKEYLSALLKQYPGVFKAVGEFTIKKEQVTAHLGDESFEISGELFGKLLKFSEETGMGLLIHCDWGNPRVHAEDTRLQATVSGYEHTDPLVAMLKQHPDANVVLAHTGIGRLVRPDNSAERGGVPGRQVVVDRGQGRGTLTVPEHLGRLYELAAASKNVRFDLSWNDVAEAITADPALMRSMVDFIVDNPTRVLYGSDTVKPVNSGHYHQSLQTLMPLVAEVAFRDPNAALRLLRHNYEQFINHAEARVNSWTRDQLKAEGRDADIAAMDRMHDVIRPERAAMRQASRDEFNAWLGNLRNSSWWQARGQIEANAALRNDPAAAAAEMFRLLRADPEVSGHPLQVAADRHGQPALPATHDARHSVYLRAYDELPAGRVIAPLDKPYGAGTAWGPAEARQKAIAALRLAAGTGLATGAAVGLEAVTRAGVDGASGGHAYALNDTELYNAFAFAARGGAIGWRTSYLDAVRLAWERTFEQGHFSHDGVDRFIGRIVDLGRHFNIAPERLEQVALVGEQFRRDMVHLYNRPLGGQWTEQARFHVGMAEVGRFQINVDRALGGLQASSITPLDARTPRGQRQRAFVAATFAVNAAATAHYFLNGHPVDVASAETWMRGLFGVGNAILAAPVLSGWASGRTGLNWEVRTNGMRWAQAIGGGTLAAGGVAWTIADGIATVTANHPASMAAHAVLTGLDAVFTTAIARSAETDFRRVLRLPMPGPDYMAKTGKLVAGSLIARIVLGVGTGAGLWAMLENRDDKLSASKAHVPLPGISPTTTWPPTTGFTPPPVDRRDPARQPALDDLYPPLPSDSQRRREKVVADGQQRQTGSLWGIAEDNVATLLTRDEERLAGSRGGQDTVVSDALAQLLQINPQRRFRPELMDGIVTAHPGDPDTVLEGWSLNVNAVTR